MATEAPPPVERPNVRLPRQGLPGAAIAAIAIVAALLLFVALDARRRGSTNADRQRVTGSAFVAPPPLALPPEAFVAPAGPPPVVRLPAPVPVFPTPAYPAAPRVQTQSSHPFVPPAPIIVPVAPAAERTERPSRAPPSPLVIDTAPGAGVPAAGAGSQPVQGQSFQPRINVSASDSSGARATAIPNRSDTVPIGTVIPIVLETPIDTARPGLVRGVTSVDTRGFDGRRVLIPRGSRLIGEYQADVRPGQNRVLVNWTRLVRPDGITIQLASPAADPLGGAGVPGRVHSFFLQRFAGALLQSALTAGVNLASRPRGGSVVVGLPLGPITTVGQGLVPTNELRPKITVKQGAVLNVFVARDLDFSAPEAAGGR